MSVTRTTFTRHLVTSKGDNEKFSYPLGEELYNLKGVEVEWLNVTNSLPTIIEGYNDTFEIALPAISTITIPQGNYTSASLAAELQTQLQGADISFVAGLDSDGTLIIVRNVGEFTLMFDNSPLPAYYLGFQPGDATSTLSVLRSPMAPNVVPYLATTISSDLIDKYTGNLGISPNGYSEGYIVATPVDYAYLSTIRYQPFKSFFIYFDGLSHLESLDFHLKTYYADGSEVPLGTFAIQPWSMSLSFIRHAL